MGYNNKSIVVYKDRYTIIRGKIYYYSDKNSIYNSNIGLSDRPRKIILSFANFANTDTKDILMNLIVKPSKILALLNINHHSFHISYIAKAILTNNYQLGEIA